MDRCFGNLWSKPPRLRDPAYDSRESRATPAFWGLVVLVFLEGVYRLKFWAVVVMHTVVLMGIFMPGVGLSARKDGRSMARRKPGERT
ncbi:hypothetical protein SPFM12_00091 [Salmonella phage SPFM12]|nr:hypothetical protein SPFM12_00091 [Salmonella phage SPFM12]